MCEGKKVCQRCGVHILTRKVSFWLYNFHLHGMLSQAQGKPDSILTIIHIWYSQIVLRWMSEVCIEWNLCCSNWNCSISYSSLARRMVSVIVAAAVVVDYLHRYYYSLSTYPLLRKFFFRSPSLFSLSNSHYVNPPHWIRIKKKQFLKIRIEF